MISDIYPNDDPDIAAKKIARDLKMSQKLTVYIKPYSRIKNRSQSYIVEKPKTQEEAFLSFIRGRFQNADPNAKQNFADKIDGVDFEVSPTKTIEEDQDQSYFVAEDSKECGITKAEYEFLQDDIAFQIQEANRKYGYGGYGFVDRFGNHYRDPQPRTIPESPLALRALEMEKRFGTKPRKIKKHKPKYKSKPVFAIAVNKVDLQSSKEGSNEKGVCSDG